MNLAMTSSDTIHRPRSSLWFFLVLAVLSAAGIVVPIVYNLSIQLHPEQLAEARERWQRHGASNYDLEYLVKTSHAGQEENYEYLVEVRAGRVVLIADQREVLYVDPSLLGFAGPWLAALSSEDPRRYGVPALFDEIEAALERDQTTDHRNYATASFDPNDGHPTHYVHRVSGTKERVEWVVKLRIISP
jgi:hypothetical protein